MTKWERRCRRESQQKYRKLGTSTATILENTQVVLCVVVGRMTEAEGAEILRVPIGKFNKICSSMISAAEIVAEKLAED